MGIESRKELAYDHFNYVLFVDDEGNYDFQVIGNNSAAYYTIDYRLTPDEIQKYHKRGKKFLGSLANRCRSSIYK